MRLLLDTHVLLWWLADMPQLGARVREQISRSANTVLSAQLALGKSKLNGLLAN
jgi:PIN domain nuclease of toxin-antitoxin system